MRAIVLHAGDNCISHALSGRFRGGQKFGSTSLRVDEERIKRFAAEFDPQPFHLDDMAARATLFQGLAASGWHTAAMTMRLLVDEFRWPRPVRPGDVLRIEAEVLEVRPSR